MKRAALTLALLLAPILNAQTASVAIDAQGRVTATCDGVGKLQASAPTAPVASDVQARIAFLPVTVAGRYVISGAITYAPDARGLRRCVINAGSLEFVRVQVPADSAEFPTSVGCMAMRTLAAGDVVELTQFQNTGAPLAITSATLTMARKP